MAPDRREELLALFASAAMSGAMASQNVPIYAGRSPDLPEFIATIALNCAEAAVAEWERRYPETQPPGE